MGFRREVETPNIMGRMDFYLRPMYAFEGALYCDDGKESNLEGSVGQYDGYWRMRFDASRSSTIYSGTKLQPSALQVLPCIRV